MRYLLLYFSVMTFNMCFKCVLILVFFRFPQKLTMAQLRHLEIGIDATDQGVSSNHVYQLKLGISVLSALIQ